MSVPRRMDRYFDADDVVYMFWPAAHATAQLFISPHLQDSMFHCCRDVEAIGEVG